MSYHTDKISVEFAPNRDTRCVVSDLPEAGKPEKLKQSQQLTESFYLFQAFVGECIYDFVLPHYIERNVDSVSSQ